MRKVSKLTITLNIFLLLKVERAAKSFGFGESSNKPANSSSGSSHPATIPVTNPDVSGQSGTHSSQLSNPVDNEKYLESLRFDEACGGHKDGPSTSQQAGVSNQSSTIEDSLGGLKLSDTELQCNNSALFWETAFPNPTNSSSLSSAQSNDKSKEE